jgi:oligo-1,6-glucosidase
MQRQWWHTKIAYQIYPKSFYDTNSDGIGDLRGIITKLDYLKELGADILWISPCYCSPFADQGYDISDYYKIDPRFGTMEDMEELLAEAKKRGMYIVMDLVVNHCSDEHEWFQKACDDPEGPYGKYFYIETCKDGKLPCNWRSYFGGPVWDKLPGHQDKYYLHVFHKKQPDLNWENPKLRREIYKMINWWLDKGVAGFRIDAIINIKKALPFRDYPADREDGLCSMDQMLSKAQGVQIFLHEMAENTFKPHNAFTVGEVFNEKECELPAFVGDDGCFSTMFDFRETIWGASDKGWYDNTPITPDAYRDCCFESQRRIGDIGFLSNIIENHDEPRGVSRYLPDGEANEYSKKLLGTVSFFLKGLPFLYQGQELGMENVTFTSVKQINDINTLDEYQVALEAGLSPEEALKAVNRYSRDNSRTPFQWNNTPNAGFTAGTPWLPVNANYPRINAEAQLADANSLFHYYQKMIALRKNPQYQETLVYGQLIPVYENQHNLMAYYRQTQSQTLLIIANFQKEKQNVMLEKLPRNVLLNNHDTIDLTNHTLTLLEYQAVVLEL